ncbi:MAG: LacI family DNA-binding transcriptional regulator [Lentisphaeria bacterium]|nr:LacI family DNA-binding transcriptional regulator [Lentisphaeria bacterium]
MAGVTLKKLAELSGLSVRTVNRVLKDQGDVAPEKRELVRRLAREYKYIPNIAARNFRLRKKNIVGVLTCDHLSSEADRQKVADLERRLLGAGYYPLLGSSRGDALRRALEEWNGTVDFVVSFRHPQSPEALKAPEDFPCTFIFVDCPAGEPYHRIAINRECGIAAAYRCLTGEKCRRIVHCGTCGLRRGFVDRITSALSGSAEFAPITTAHCELEDGFAAGDAIMRSGADAVFFDTDRMALGFYRYAWAHRIRIPDDISVVGFDDDPFARVLPPPLATVAHSVAEIAQTIVEIVTSAPDHPVRRTLDTRLVRRDSIRRG